MTFTLHKTNDSRQIYICYNSLLLVRRFAQIVCSSLSPLIWEVVKIELLRLTMEVYELLSLRSVDSDLIRGANGLMV